jgi:hypothetical protein
VPAQFRDSAAAKEKLQTLRAFHLGNEATAEAVRIPEGARDADKYLGNIED